MVGFLEYKEEVCLTLVFCKDREDKGSLPSCELLSGVFAILDGA